ncbi:class I SAM-dependent methyltransferase [Nocardioides donggukensis]|uniref:Class I SAM-dependent methyltransferase n=1 Tax=Nocardioides donggukensis TaxID=2774019 RepID=A0A927Q103_9ACTN|nr:class I SAM-dependent methyltransferase [Nocardioides donggukensis]MBD8869522.1 class I SAM-dependent methyltransferase [Nocardioides donggukensis]
MGVWSEHALPRLVDRACAGPDLDERRAALAAGLHGRVLEIGFGSGLSLPHYPAAVHTVCAVEPSDLAWRLSERRRAAASLTVERSGLDGQRLTEADASCDAALSTFTLCTIPDPVRALLEVRRVLRPGGRLHVLEHGAAPDPRVARWQRRLDPVQRRVAGGCHLSRDIPALLEAAGLEIEDLTGAYLPGPTVSRPWTFGYVGTARAPA